ncbi:MAG: CHAT domain-containing protein [Bacteroidales bacterium]|jgi:CHAT domain-containing protein|nr:CHAT domain-containing protein [Bacteroidales bacterium]
MYHLSTTKRMVFTRILVIILFTLGCKQLNAQHKIFAHFANLRDIEKKQEYLEIDKNYSRKEKLKAITSIDSLAEIYRKKGNYEDYLFCKNQVANLYKSVYKFKEAINTLYSSRNIFAQNHDTIHIEYLVSKYTNIFIPPRYYNGKTTRLKLCYSALDIARGLDYNKIKVENNPYNKLLQFSIKTAFYYQDYNNCYLLSNELRDILKQEKNYYELAEIDRMYMSYTFTESRDLQPSIILAYENYINLIEKHWDNYERFHDLSAEVILRLSSTLTNYYNSINEYQKAIDIYNKVPLDLVNKRSVFIADCYTSLACLYLHVNDTAKANKYTKKSEPYVYSKMFADANRSLLTTNYARKIYPLDSTKGEELFNLALKYSKNKKRKDYVGYGKFTVLINENRYSDAIDWSVEHFGYDTTKTEKVINFDLKVPLQRIFCNLNYSEACYHKYLTTNNDFYRDQFERHALIGYKEYMDLWNSNTSSHELHDIQNRYNGFLSGIILESYLNKFQFKILTEDIIMNMIISSKSQTTNNGIKRIANESGLSKNDSLFNAYTRNLKEIQLTKNKLKVDRNNDSLTLILTDQLYNNYWLRKFITDQKSKSRYKSADIKSIPDIQKKLNDKEAFIEYYTFKDAIYSIVITNKESKLKCIKTTGLKKKYRRFIKELKTGQLKESTNRTIAELLINPINNNLNGIKKIVIIPHGWINYIPFEVLTDISNTDKMLIDKYTISYNYSSQIWVSGIKKEKPKNRSILLIAPFAGKSSDSIVLTNSYRSKTNFEMLPYSGREISKISRIFKKNNGISTILKNESATEKAYNKIYSNFEIIHFSTHGSANKKDYERSGVYLYQDKNNNSKFNHEEYISLGDIFATDYKPNLVVLSACKTGIGVINKGEGIMSLPRGFIYAGVPNVIASLWKVNDKATKDLMISFYNHLLKDNSGYSDALQKAKQDCIQKGYLPIDWAGFILIGD